MTEIAIYVEGGGDTVAQKAELRQGLERLISPQKTAAQRKRIRWKLIPCGGRQAAYGAFANALAKKPAVINVLLVDSETAVPPETGNSAKKAKTRVAHLAAQHKWKFASTIADRVHLMVQCMEAWLVADPAALAGYYKHGFREKVLPARPNLEEEPKSDIYDKLERATKATQKGAYGKIRHASQLLRRIDPNKVAVRCPRFATFTQWLTQTIEEA